MTENDFGTIPATPANIPGPASYEQGEPAREYAREDVAPAVRKPSPLDHLKAEAKKDIEEFVTYDVKGRPGFKVQFSTAIDADDVRRWQKNAQGKRKNPADADPLVSASCALLEQNRAIFYQGDTVEDSTGDNMLLNSNEFSEMFGGMGGLQALRKFLGDGQLLSMAGAVLLEGGYGDDFEPVDPHKP